MYIYLHIHVYIYKLKKIRDFYPISGVMVFVSNYLILRFHLFSRFRLSSLVWYDQYRYSDQLCCCWWYVVEEECIKLRSILLYLTSVHLLVNSHSFFVKIDIDITCWYCMTHANNTLTLTLWLILLRAVSIFYSDTSFQWPKLHDVVLLWSSHTIVTTWSIFHFQHLNITKLRYN